MKKIENVLAVLIITSFALATHAVAQTGSGGCPGGNCMRHYDPSTETTVKGSVDEVVQQTGARGFTGTHVLLKIDTGNLTVHVGPSSYISAQGFSFAKGDALEIIGSKVKINGQDVLLAREVKKDGKVLTLRDAKGFPMWSHGRQRPS